MGESKVTIYDGAVDKGLEGVVACTTHISFIVGATLNFRGYEIEDLAANSNFEETVFLLWNSRLPKADELTKFREQLAREMSLPAELVEILKKIPNKDVHPMAWLRSATSLLAHWDVEAQNMSKEANLRKAVRLTAKMGTLVATFERLRTNQSVLTPNPTKGIAWNFLYLLKGKEPDAEVAKVFDTALVLHADHELNCSAFASRVTASSLSDMHSAVVSAISALKGPLHGGANEQVMIMLKEIGSLERAQGWVKEALAGKQKIMGFGHRVYKNGDPRAKILRKYSEVLTAKMGEPQWYKMSALIDDTVQAEKGLMPNVDFYSASVYYSMGIPIDIYTPIFAVSRVAGWAAHVLEQYENNRIYRPRGNWKGLEGLKWQAIEKR